MAEDDIRNFGELTSDPSNDVQELQKNVEYLSSRKQVAVKNKEFSVRKRYFCFRFRSKCKATLTGRYYPKEDIWGMTKSNIYNHGPIAPNPIVKRGPKYSFYEN